MKDNTRGAILMMASTAAFTVNDSLMKMLYTEVTLFQAMFFRGLGASAIFLVLAWQKRAFTLPKGKDLPKVILRTLAEIGAGFFFLTSLKKMPLANATAILQSLPLVMTLVGALFLREKVGLRRIVAVILGLLGVIIIVRPGAEGFTIYSLLAFTAVICLTLRDTATRMMSFSIPSVTVALAGSLGVTVFSGFGAVFEGGWHSLSPRAGLLLGGVIVLLVFGYLSNVLTMRCGELSFVAPFRYTSLFWAILLGFLFFGELPDLLTLIGAGLVVVTGIITLDGLKGRVKRSFH